MLDEVLAGQPLLAGVMGLGEPVGPLDLLGVGLRVVGPEGSEHRLQAVPGLPFLRPRSQAREQTSPAFGPGLLPAVHAVLLPSQCSRAVANSVADQREQVVAVELLPALQ